MRYIITQTQLHSLVYKYLDSLFDLDKMKKRPNPYNPDAYRIDLKPKETGNEISYFWYGPGEYDDGTPHNGIGTLHVHPNIVDTLRQMIPVRESKIIDMVSDWFSEKFQVDVDDFSIYPERKTPAIY